jgi:hypothetical protein
MPLNAKSPKPNTEAHRALARWRALLGWLAAYALVFGALCLLAHGAPDAALLLQAVRPATYLHAAVRRRADAARPVPAEVRAPVTARR